MLLKFSVKNFKNFENEFVLDFTDASGYQFNENCIITRNNIKTIGKMLIIGENSVGKTNLGEALLNLRDILFSLIYRTRSREKIVNADSDGNVCEFTYEFFIEECKIKYSYSFDENLDFVNEKFYVFDKILYENNFDGDLSLFKSNIISIDHNLYNGYKKYKSNNSETIEDNEDIIPFRKSLFLQYLLMSNTGDRILNSLFSFVLNMTKQTQDILRPVRNDVFLKSLYDDNEKLKKLETFFRKNGIECNLFVEKSDERYDLYFKHKKGNVSFYESASSGTKRLYQLYRKICNSLNSGFTFIYLDEYDAFYHYELSRNVLKFLIDSMPNVQIIITSHNTNLINNELLRPDCIKIMTKNNISSLSQSTNRELREGHNLEKMYISGEFNIDE